MRTVNLKLLIKLRALLDREEGQDLVEYALLIAMIALAAIAGIGKVSTAVTAAFTNISTKVATGWFLVH